MVAVFVPLLLFGALRVDFGLDYHNYENEFYRLHTLGHVNADAHSEIGFQYLMLYMPSWRLMLVLTSLLISGSWAYLFYKNVANRQLWFAVVLLFLCGNFAVYTPLVAMRNGITISIMIFCFRLIRSRKYLMVLVVTYLGALIHSSLMLALPVALLIGQSKPLTKRDVSAWWWSLVLCVFLGQTALVNLIAPYILEGLDRYEYVVEGVKSVNHSAVLFMATNIFIFAVIIKWFYQFKDRLSDSENSYIRLGMAYLFLGFLGPLGGARMMAYFLPFFILTLVRMFGSSWRNPYLKLFFFALIIAYMLYSFYYVWQWNNPYFVFGTYHSVLGSL